MDSPIEQSDSFVDFLPPPPPEPAPDNIRNLLPDYRIDHLLGSGGFADVYYGNDEDGKAFALKIPKIDGNLASKDPKVMNRFKSEAELWMRLDHRNIVKLHSIKTEPLPHMAMELMAGGSLKQLMKKHKLTIGETVQIMVQVLEGLSYAHKMASVHRDMKPENILFSTRGVAKITDWGIGKFMASESVTGSQDFKGTLSHSAPEQFNKREYGNVDWQTDIFQIGVMFYKMVTGKNPFKGEDIADCMGKVLMDQPEQPSSLNSEVPKELDEVIMGALKKRKEDRWGTDVMLYKLKEISEKKIISFPDQRSDPDLKTLHQSPEITQNILQSSDSDSKTLHEAVQVTHGILQSTDSNLKTLDKSPEITPNIVQDSDPSTPQEQNISAENTTNVSSTSPNTPPKIYSLALITFILSIVGVIAVSIFVFFSIIPRPVSIAGIVIFGILFGIAGMYFNAISMRKIDNEPLQYKGRQMAIVGIIIGIILLIGGILGVIYRGII